MTGEVGARARPLSDLKLDRQLLTMFVVGPGFGESVLLAMPRSEAWIVVDGARPENAPPAKQVLEQHWSANGSIELLLLTHPHHDHYAGLREILDDVRLGDAVRRIGCVSHYVDVAHANTLGLEVEAAFAGNDIDDPEAQRELGSARNVLERIADEWLKRPDRRWEALEGARLDLENDVGLRVLGPARSHVEDFFTSPDLARRIQKQANDLSVVLEVRFGKTNILLGGDLPDRRNEKPVASGWSHLCSAFPRLNEHTGYKVAHHASAEAIHPGIGAACGHPRSWLVTPYNKGKKLPDFDDRGGVEQLQSFQPELLLTAMPVGIEAQMPQPEWVRREDLAPATVALRQPRGRLGPPVAAGRRATVTPTQCIWAVQFDDDAHVVSSYRGQAATVVI